jgi:glycosyltransferase involved in cell wall biosynthesis
MISVIVPSHNRAHTIRRALDSVLNQTERNFEIIVVDDGSTDETGHIIVSEYTSVRLCSINHSGVSVARNVGILHAIGTWIAFLDSDDYWMPKKLEEQISYLEHHPEFKICHTDEIWIRGGKRINQGKKHRKYPGWFFVPSLQRCLISPSSVIIHRSVFDAVGLFDEDFSFVEDYELWLRITALYPVGYIDKKLVVKTGGHEDQLSKKINGIEGYRISALEKLLRTFPLRNDFHTEALRVLRKKYEIYLTGCRKRGRFEEAENIERSMETLQGMGMISLDRGSHEKDTRNR